MTDTLNLTDSVDSFSFLHTQYIDFTLNNQIFTSVWLRVSSGMLVAFVHLW